PSRTELVARKSRGIHDEHVRARACERPGAGRPRRAAAGDDDVHVAHQRSSASSEYTSARVQRTVPDEDGANSTWKSCSDPTVNAASEAVRYSRHARQNASPN